MTAMSTDLATVTAAIVDRFTPDRDYAAYSETWRIWFVCGGVPFGVHATGYGDAEGTIGSRVCVTVDGVERRYVTRLGPRREAKRAAKELALAVGCKLPRFKWYRRDELTTMVSTVVGP